MGTYQEIYRRSLEDRERFWLDAAAAIGWDKPPTRALDDANPPFFRWFPDGVLNTCWNAIDRWVEAGRGEQEAILYDSPVTGSVSRWTYEELRSAVARVAGALLSLGVEKGDRVVVYMPMVPEAVIVMLACARIGAIHSVVFGGFASRELAMRIDDVRPKVVVSASCGIEVDRVVEYKPLLDEAIELAAHRPEHCVVLQRDQARSVLVPERDVDWHELVAGAEPADCVPMAATDPLYVLYTSGTTAQPKGVVRDHGGHAVALRWSVENLYGAGPGDVYWAASDVGWVVGHSYIVYGPLLAGCTTVIYEGKPVGTPDPGAFWRVVEQHGVNVLFTAPTAFRAIKKEDPDGVFLRSYDVSSLRTLFLAGERLDPDTYHWASELLGIPVVDHWWQTETGWPIACNPMGLGPHPIKAGSAGVAVPGYDIRVLNRDASEVPVGEEGAIAIRLPLPPGTLPTVWGDDQRFIDAYLETFPGYYVTGDGGHVDDDGYLFVMGRIDDVINVAGHRLSTGAMEEVVSTHPAVAECAVIGVADDVKGQVPLAFVVLKEGSKRIPDELERELVGLVRDRIGPVAAFKRAVVVARLPKTRSGKILRSTMRALVDGESYAVPSTIDEPAILDEIAASLGPRSTP